MAVSKRPAIVKAAWEKAVPNRRRHGHLNVWGGEGSGKSHLAATIPKPAGVLDFDMNFDRVLDSFNCDDFKIAPIRYYSAANKELTQTECEEAWKKLEACYHDAMGWARGIIIDTDTEMWELVRLADHGTAQPKGNRLDRLWGPTNTKMLRLLRGWRAHSVNLVTVSMQTEIYVEGKDQYGKRVSKPTGEMGRAGFKKLLYTADASVRCFKDDGAFHAELTVCKNNIALEGMLFSRDELTFATIMGTCTGTDPEEWI